MARSRATFLVLSRPVFVRPLISFECKKSSCSVQSWSQFSLRLFCSSKAISELQINFKFFKSNRVVIEVMWLIFKTSWLWYYTYLSSLSVFRKLFLFLSLYHSHLLHHGHTHIHTLSLPYTHSFNAASHVLFLLILLFIYRSTILIQLYQQFLFLDFTFNLINNLFQDDWI